MQQEMQRHLESDGGICPCPGLVARHEELALHWDGPALLPLAGGRDGGGDGRRGLPLLGRLLCLLLQWPLLD